MTQIPTTVPRIPDIGVMAFVPDTWDDGVWQLRHQILTRLSLYFNVVWSNPPIGWRDSIRAAPFRSKFHRPHIESAPGLQIFQHSKLASKFYRPRLIAELTDRSRAKAGIGHLRQYGSEICIGYLWRPELAGSLWAGDFDKRCYHIDDEYSFSTTEQPITERERQIIENVDQVFIHSPAMIEKKGHLNSNTTYVPNGVDYGLYAKSHSVPGDLEKINGPIVEYIGVLQSTIDWQLLARLAMRLSQMSFVFVGPEGFLDPSDKNAIGVLEDLPNTYFLGGKPVEELAGYAAHADICIMPYKVNDYTKYIFPLKVNEYLAAGKPTVGSPIRTLKDYSDVLDLAESTDEWCAALAKNLQPERNSDDMVERRRAAARGNDWQILVDRIGRSICSLAGASYVDQFDALTEDSC